MKCPTDPDGKNRFFQREAIKGQDGGTFPYSIRQPKAKRPEVHFQETGWKKNVFHALLSVSIRTPVRSHPRAVGLREI